MVVQGDNLSFPSNIVTSETQRNIHSKQKSHYSPLRKGKNYKTYKVDHWNTYLSVSDSWKPYQTRGR
ncbi:hypothetical protein MtrunA17_Chr8g0369801 [Medicago truncatula]|uniref:Uncharacterized protein n=1 Tax=Medicago truncatula TaxID=3880 RepID=G7L7U6_MEDTR|nr:hypothetical protein MTR_8g072290 [Medicago truncatula]RHN41789.1 hypothetical protein MtrunA17_Chr8g0369801 [Medicago truncatula]